jgi:putative membrane protein
LTEDAFFDNLVDMSLLIRLILNAAAVAITAYLLQAGVTVDSIWTTFIVAIVLGAINLFIKPIISLIALPINLLTLGLFSLVINGLLIMLASALVPGFEVNGFLWAVLFSIVLSIVNAVLSSFSK